MTTDSAHAPADDTTTAAADAAPPAPAPAAEETPPLEGGPMVALEVGKAWILGRESEGTDADGRKRAAFEDGSVRTYRNRPGTVRSVTPGTMLHRLVLDTETMRERMRTEPAEVIVEILAEVRTPLNKGQIEAKLDDLRLLPEDPWWPKAAAALKAHPRVVVERGRYGLKRSEEE